MYNMKQNIKQPYEIIHIDKQTGAIKTPSLLLMNRSFQKIGKINNFDNWNISLSANAADEISFDVHKYCNGSPCAVWNELIDLKIVEVIGFGRFEISVDCTDNTETVKSVHGISLETELAQVMLHDFHVNDEDAVDPSSKYNYDADGNYIPTTFYREISDHDSADDKKFKREHSLLHRVLAAAPHWGIGYVTPYIALNEESEPEESQNFQRTYTADGESIYDFLTGTVAEESNVVFIFDTLNRLIHCYSLCDCIDQKTGAPKTDKYGNKVTSIGCDTSVFVSKNRLANEITISSSKDNVKNCFRVEGGDDTITAMVRTVNMNGSNEIYRFAKFQYDDMSKSLKEKLDAYQNMMADDKTKDTYYGYGDILKFLDGELTLRVSSPEESASVLSLCREHNTDTSAAEPDSYKNLPFWSITISENRKRLILSSSSENDSCMSASEAFHTMGIYPRLYMAYDDLLYYESSMMPNTEKGTNPGKAETQYRTLAAALADKDFYLAVSSSAYSNQNQFTGITNNVEAFAQTMLDSRFDLSVFRETAVYDSKNHIWKGKMQVIQHTNEKNAYPADVSSAEPIIIKITDEKEALTIQKIQKELSRGSMSGIDSETARIWGDKNLDDNEKMNKIRDYFNLYSINRLESFRDGYESCRSALMNMGYSEESDTEDGIYRRYCQQIRIISNPEPDDVFPELGVLEKRQEQAAKTRETIKRIKEEQQLFLSGYIDEQSGITYPPHDFQTYMGEDFLEFCKYRREDTYKNDNYISDGLSSAECLKKAKELIEVAGKELGKACTLQRTVSTSLNNLFALPEFEPLYESFALFNYIRVQTEDEILKLRLIGIDFNGDSSAEINVTFSEQIESADGPASDLQNIIQQAASMSSSYPSTVLQAKQGAEAEQEIQNMHENGLNASETMFANNNSNEITITPSGILCKRMDDEGFYGDKQLRITGNIMAFTDDNWKSVKMAIGETLIDDPTAPEGTPKTPAYGIIAENIVGKFIASEKAYIGNESGSVLIDKDGIDIKDGSITLSNGEYTIELDPNHRQSKTSNNAPNREQSNIQNDYLFCIRDASDEKNVIMGVDTNGAGYFSGNITASNITGGVINIKDKFIVGPEGNVSLPKGTTLSWDDIKNTEDILTKDNFSSIITKDYISSLKATAGSILSQNGDHKTSINAGQISSTYYNLIDNAAENSNLLPGIGKLNAEQTNITNSVILLDNQTKIEKPLFIAGGADSVSTYPSAALYANGRIYSSEEVCPSKDSSFSCGHPDYKWSVVYAKSGAINTSDRNQKHDIQSIAEIYEKLFFRLKPVNFMFDNGDRIHTGIIAQDLKESMDELGLSATEVAAFCRDKKTKIGKDEQTEEVIEVPDLDENGSPRYNYGVRYSEFIMLNTHMIQKLYKEKEEMKKEIDSLKESVTHLHDKIETRIQGIN